MTITSEQFEGFIEWISAALVTRDALSLMQNADADQHSKDLASIHPLLERLADKLEQDHLGTATRAASLRARQIARDALGEI
jgi:hypothetical protein